MMKLTPSPSELEVSWSVRNGCLYPTEKGKPQYLSYLLSRLYSQSTSTSLGTSAMVISATGNVELLLPDHLGVSVGSGGHLSINRIELNALLLHLQQPPS